MSDTESIAHSADAANILPSIMQLDLPDEARRAQAVAQALDRVAARVAYMQAHKVPQSEAETILADILYVCSDACLDAEVLANNLATWAKEARDHEGEHHHG